MDVHQWTALVELLIDSLQDSEFAAGTAAGFAGAMAPDRQGPVRTLKLLPDGMKNVRLEYCSPRRPLQNYFFSGWLTRNIRPLSCATRGVALFERAGRRNH